MIGFGCCTADAGTWTSRCESSAGPPDLSIDAAWSTAELDTLPPDYPAVVRTVVAGDTSEDLSVRFLGLYPDARSGFLLWLETDPCEPRWARWHGVAAGMSGSPVLIDGRLAGALSSRFGSGSEPPFPFGATPMDVVLGATEPHGQGAHVVSTLLNPVPLVLNSGAGREAPDHTLQGELDMEASSEEGEPRLPPPDGGVATPCMAGAAGCAEQRLSAGDAIAVNVLTSNLYTIAAMGTVTAADDERLWAFGHPFLANGDSALPFSREAEVDLTLANQAWASDLMEALAALRARFPDHTVKHIDLWRAYSEQASHLELLSMDVLSADGSGPIAVDAPVAVRPGDELHVVVHAFDSAAKTLLELPVNLRVPEEIAAGPIVLEAARSRLHSVPAPALEDYARSFEQEVEAMNDAASADDVVFVSLYGIDAIGNPVIAQEARLRIPAQVVSVGLPVIEHADFPAYALRVVEVLEPGALR